MEKGDVVLANWEQYYKEMDISNITKELEKDGFLDENNYLFLRKSGKDLTSKFWEKYGQKFESKFLEIIKK